MSLLRRVAWNTAAQAGARLFTLALAVVTTSLLTRHFGASGYGVYVTVMVYVPFFVMFFDAGLTTYVVRSLSADAERTDVYRDALGLRLALTLPIALVALALALLVYGDDAKTRTAIAIALPLILFMTIASATGAVFQARLQLDRVALCEVGGQVVATALIVLFVVAGTSIYAVVAAAVAGAFVNMVLLLALARRIVSVRPLVSKTRWALLVRRALPLGLALMIATVYFRADAFLLSTLKGTHAVGIYGVAYRLLEAAIQFPGFFYLAIFPLLSQAAARRDLEQLRAVTQRAFDVLVLTAVPLVCGSVVLAPRLVDALAGDGFGAAVTPFRIVIAGAGLMFVSGLFSYVLIALGRQRALLWTGAVTLTFNVALNLVFIPRYSYNAAAVIATASEALALTVLMVVVARAAAFVPALPVAARAAAGGAVMIAFLAMTPANLALLILIGIGAYGAALLLLRTPASLQLRWR